MKKQTIASNSPEETQALAASLLRGLKRGAVLALHGELGSGKTCFVQGLAAALGVEQIVASPSYTLINEYAGRCPLYHIDLYRLQNISELHELGLEDYFETDGITAVEWAERAADLLPETALHVYFETLANPDARTISMVYPF